MVKLDIISDPICPWCFIAKAYLDRALEQRADHPFTIEWHPFQLNPDMPAGGMDRRTYLERKFGGQDRAVQAYLPVVEHAAKAGLDIDLEGIKTTPNTLDAHRLIYWAGIEGRQTPVVRALFKAYFQQGRDIGSRDTLIGIAVEAGLDRDMITRLMITDADLADTHARDQSLRDMGVNSVPTFIIAGQHVVTGAQPSEFWVNVIDDILQSLSSDADQGPTEVDLA
jgi:predicted DsbA family dithiol-disulfide isomerase